MISSRVPFSLMPGSLPRAPLHIMFIKLRIETALSFADLFEEHRQRPITLDSNKALNRFVYSFSRGLKTDNPESQLARQLNAENGPGG